MSLVSGIEPNSFAGKVSRDKGFTVYSEMLNESLCRKIVDKFGKFEIVVVRQTIEHLLDIKKFFSCLNILLSDSGFLFIDTPDFETSLLMGDCSTLWEEHISYFTEFTLKNVLLSFGFEPVSVKKYNFSGGIIAVLAQRTGVTIKPQSSDKLRENAVVFRQKVDRYGNLIRKVLTEYRKREYKIVLYGVGCRASVIVNVLNLKEYIDFAIDDQVKRQNKYMAGSRLHIRSPQTLKDFSGSVVCLLAVNQESEDAVRGRLKNISGAHIEFISLFSPNDIWVELKRGYSRLSQEAI